MFSTTWRGIENACEHTTLVRQITWLAQPVALAALCTLLHGSESLSPQPVPSTLDDGCFPSSALLGVLIFLW